MSDSQPSDDAIRERLLQHFNSQGRSYCHVAYGFVRCWETAQELCQDAFAKAWACRHEIRDWEALDQWLVSVVVNDSLRHIRRQRQERKVLREKRQQSTACGDAQKEVENREAAMHALDQLPEPLRVVVALRCVQGLSNEEVSRILRLTYWQTAKRYYRGIDLMRKCMFEDVDDAASLNSPLRPADGIDDASGGQQP